MIDNEADNETVSETLHRCSVRADSVYAINKTVVVLVSEQSDGFKMDVIAPQMSLTYGIKWLELAKQHLLRQIYSK
jgi:hypothetical protein